VVKKKTNDALCGLLVGDYEDSRPLVKEVFREAGWRLLEARDREKALEHLQSNKVHVVITSSEMPGWEWKAALENLRNMEQPPQLIVSSRMADEQLWAEVLNYGAYDVLPRPFQRDELERVVAAARRHYDPRPTRVTRAKPASEFSVA
jgi:DNA-binding response OmpR family regulator